MSVELPNGYHYIHEGEDFRVISGQNYIPPTVISYAYDSNYIVLARIPFSETLQKHLNTVEFYLIDIYNHTLHGPLDCSEYLKLKNKFKITLKLALEL